MLILQSSCVMTYSFKRSGIVVPIIIIRETWKVPWQVMNILLWSFYGFSEIDFLQMKQFFCWTVFTLSHHFSSHASFVTFKLSSGLLLVPQMLFSVLQCLTEKGYELARVSLVDSDGKCILEELVKPPNRVFNYLTKYTSTHVIIIIIIIFKVQFVICRDFEEETATSGCTLDCSARLLPLPLLSLAVDYSGLRAQTRTPCPPFSSMAF